MTSFITDNLGSTENAIIVAAVAITTIGGTIAMIADFNEKYATS